MSEYQLLVGTFIGTMGILIVNIVFYAKKWHGPGGKTG